MSVRNPLACHHGNEGACDDCAQEAIDVAIREERAACARLLVEMAAAKDRSMIGIPHTGEYAAGLRDGAKAIIARGISRDTDVN